MHHSTRHATSGAANLYSSLPGAVGMYALSLGVQKMNDVLPEIAYAFLSGLNASTVGIIALAAVQLAEKAIKDKLTRILVIFGACAGLCYSALWYFPLLIVLGGLSVVVWDGWMSQYIRKTRAKWRRRNSHPEEARQENGAPNEMELQVQQDSQMRSTPSNQGTVRSRKAGQAASLPETVSDAQTESLEVNSSLDHIIRIRVGVTVCVVFFGTFLLFARPTAFHFHPGALLTLNQPPLLQSWWQEGLSTSHHLPWTCSATCIWLEQSFSAEVP